MEDIFAAYQNLSLKLRSMDLDEAFEITLPRTTYDAHWAFLLGRHEKSMYLDAELAKLLKEGTFRWRGIVFKRGMY